MVEQTPIENLARKLLRTAAGMFVTRVKWRSWSLIDPTRDGGFVK
jgi:hypothetical protein